MAQVFVLRRRESLAEAFRRIAAGQLTRAAAALTSAGLSRQRRVHEARKRFKESRALVRLYRGLLGDAFAEENRWYRDAGRALAAFRDATAAACAIDSLPEEMQREVGDEAMRALRRAVREHRDALYADAAAVDAAIGDVLARFDAERRRIETLPLDGGPDAVEKSFAATIAAGREAMAEAYATRDVAAFHEWRKRVKDQWYHTLLFRPVWPELMAARADALKKLSRLLGEHHDLGVVGALVTDAPALTRALIVRQRAIAARARLVGAKLYAVRPRDRARETMALWRAWHR